MRCLSSVSGILKVGVRLNKNILTSADEDIEVLGVRLHVRNRLDRASSTSNDCDALVLPLICLIVLGPPSRVNDLN